MNIIRLIHHQVFVHFFHQRLIEVLDVAKSSSRSIKDGHCRSTSRSSSSSSCMSAGLERRRRWNRTGEVAAELAQYYMVPDLCKACIETAFPAHRIPMQRYAY